MGATECWYYSKSHTRPHRFVPYTFPCCKNNLIFPLAHFQFFFSLIISRIQNFFFPFKLNFISFQIYALCLRFSHLATFDNFLRYLQFHTCQWFSSADSTYSFSFQISTAPFLTVAFSFATLFRSIYLSFALYFLLPFLLPFFNCLLFFSVHIIFYSPFHFFDALNTWISHSI